MPYSTSPSLRRKALARRPTVSLTAILCGLVVLVLVLTQFGTADGQTTVTRLDAGTAVQAGTAVSQRVFADGATQNVILVRDDSFADGLVAGPLTGELPGLAPILFTPSDALPDSVLNEIDRVTGGSGTVHIIGGTVAVDRDVEDMLGEEGYNVQRVSGQTRIETAQAVFDTYFAADLAGGDVMIARAFGTTADESDAWPDAITGGGFGAARGVPILLTPTDRVPSSVLSRLEDAGAALVLGGTSAIDPTAFTQLEDAVEEVLRAAGDTREETGVAVATDLFGIPALQADDIVVLVNGRSSFAFGLAAAALSAAGQDAGDAPILLVTADSPTEDCGTGGQSATATACYLSAEGTAPGEIVLVGDDTQISRAVEQFATSARNSTATS